MVFWIAAPTASAYNTSSIIRTSVCISAGGGNREHSHSWQFSNLFGIADENSAHCCHALQIMALQNNVFKTTTD